MQSRLEHRRHVLEEIGAIEDALARRIAKSDTFLPPGLRQSDAPEGTPASSLRGRRRRRRRSYSARENAVRRLDAAMLIARHAALKTEFDKIVADADPATLEDELAACDALSDTVPAESVAEQYRNLHTRGLARLTSKATQPVLARLHTDFPPQEHFGKFVDMEQLYRAQMPQTPQTPSQTPPQTYRDFLLRVPELAHENRDIKAYLVSFYNRYFSLGPGTGTSAAEVAPPPPPPPRRPAAQPDTVGGGSGSTYCDVCAKPFANDNVFAAHLSGKKHQRNASLSARDADECDIYKLCALLSPTLNATIANLDRKQALSSEERKIEVERVYQERELENEAVSETEDEYHAEHLAGNGGDEETDTEGSSSQYARQLRGPQGTPIPRWLFKLHGLGTSFACEICGFDVHYSGRKAFERHFTSKDACHSNGLRQLGIQPAPAYTGIATIKEALELQKTIAAATKPKTEREVEDEEGNVMGERMYEDLKRQGLI